MIFELTSLKNWFRAKALPDGVYGDPEGFVEEARLVWSPQFAPWLSAHAQQLREVASTAVRAVGAAVPGARRWESFSVLWKDGLSKPLPASWDAKLQKCGNGAAILDARRLMKFARQVQAGSPYLAALAVNALLRDDPKGKPWLGLWPAAKGAEMGSAALREAAQLCRLLDLIARWTDAALDLSADQPHLPPPVQAIATASKQPDAPQRPAQGSWLTLKQASAMIGDDEQGKPLVPTSSLRKHFLKGDIAGTRAADSCNGRILLSRQGLEAWLKRTDPRKRQVLSPAQAGRANRSAR